MGSALRNEEGKNGLSLWESLLSAVWCVSLQHGGLHQPRGHRPMAPQGAWAHGPPNHLPSRLPGTLPQARYEREIGADVPAKHRPRPSKANPVPRHLERRGHLCACEACLQGRVELGCPGGGKIGPRLQAWLALWVGRTCSLSSLLQGKS